MYQGPAAGLARRHTVMRRLGRRGERIQSALAQLPMTFTPFPTDMYIAKMEDFRIDIVLVIRSSRASARTWLYEQVAEDTNLKNNYTLKVLKKTQIISFCIIE